MDSGCECDDTKAAILYPLHEDFSGTLLFMPCVKKQNYKRCLVFHLDITAENFSGLENNANGKLLLLS